VQPLPAQGFSFSGTISFSRIFYTGYNETPYERKTVKDRIKKFYDDHERAIVLSGVVIASISASTAASYISTRSGLKQLRIASVDVHKTGERVRITYQNGDQDYYHAKNIS
jgi:hypothetical protein